MENKMNRTQEPGLGGVGESGPIGCGCKRGRSLVVVKRQQSSSPYSPSSIIRRGFNLSPYFFVGTVIITFLSVSTTVPMVDGLQCYECLSLSCRSLAVCESIKRTMLEVFVPKGHIIHFNPLDTCPEGEEPGNSTKWEELSRECQRSDSVCLVSPIEIISILDGSKGGKKLEGETSLTTTGYLRGCASRRKLQENDPTIRVNVNLLSAGGNKKNQNRSSSVIESGSSSSSFGHPSQDLEMELDLSKLKFDDGYEIKKVYSHEFFLDQGTVNATKCFEDKCNTKVRIRSGVGRISGGRIEGVVGIIIFAWGRFQIYL